MIHLHNRGWCASHLAFIVALALVVDLSHSETVTSSSRVVTTIAAWNVQVFGRSFMQENESVAVLVDSILKWDITLIQEIRDNTGVAVVDLLNCVNSASTRGRFDLVISPRLGYSTSKEQYGFIYHNESVNVIDTFLTPDLEDRYSREPYNVLFELRNGFRFFAMPLHAVPDNATLEINELKASYEEAALYFNETKALIMGDLNADCSYVGPSDWANISLCGPEEFVWLVDDTADTTTGATDCAYDRFVASGGLSLHVVADSVHVYNHTAIYNLTQEAAVRMSDHHAIVLVLETMDIGSPIPSGSPSSAGPSRSPSPPSPVSNAPVWSPTLLLTLALMARTVWALL